MCVCPDIYVRCLIAECYNTNFILLQLSSSKSIGRGKLCLFWYNFDLVAPIQMTTKKSQLTKSPAPIITIDFQERIFHLFL